MNIKIFLLALAAIQATMVSQAGAAGLSYTENFESSTPTSGALIWDGPTFRRVNSWLENGNIISRSGSRAINFDHPVGPNTTSEERFRLNSAHNEIWIKFWFRVPSNFEHTTRSDVPSNSKLFALWMDDYSYHGLGPTLVWVFWDDGNRGSVLAIHYNPGASPDDLQKGTIANNSVTGPSLQNQPFISVPRDRGRWMEIVLHAKAASAPRKADGLIETYRRWAGETNFTRLHYVPDADIAMPPASLRPEYQGWKAGYFMGWSNPGYDVPTSFYIDDVEMKSTMDLNIPSSGATTPAPPPSQTGPDILAVPQIKSAVVR